jgi:hypothetical protein
MFGGCGIRPSLEVSVNAARMGIRVVNVILLFVLSYRLRNLDVAFSSNGLKRPDEG